MTENTDKVVATIMLASVSMFAAFTTTLNKFANDKQNNKTLYWLVYVSDALMATTCGLVLALIAMTRVDNQIYWFLAAAIGGITGKSVFYIALKMVIMMIANAKSINLEQLNNINLGDSISSLPNMEQKEEKKDDRKSDEENDT